MSKKIKIAIPELPIDNASLPSDILENCELFEGEKGKRGDNSTLTNVISEVDAIVFNSSNNITEELMKSAPNLKIVFKSGAWPENVDFEYAKNNGIAVGWTPGANAQSVAEYTVMLMLAASKKFLHGADTISKGKWRDQSHIGQDICGKTVGLIGLGAIGCKVAKMIKGFSAKVIAYDPYIKTEVFEKEQITSVSFDELLAQADLVSLHCLLTDNTRKMLNDTAFRKMKKTAILINSARGGLVDEDALVKAIQDKKIAGAALDVFSEEPLPKDHPLQKFDNVTLTPHMAARTNESAYRECVWALQGIVDYLQGNQINNARVVVPNAKK